MKNLISGMMIAAVALMLMSAAPAGYYSALEGKSGAELKTAVKKAALPEDFVTIVYGMGHTSFKTWQAFEITDVRMIQGKPAWWDMYSNRLVYVESGVSSLNIEHSVANSWWGGEAGNVQAYSDLFHLNPSNSEANGKKSNNPLGVVGANPAYNNGMTRVGAPAAGYGGGATTVFEPADEYKGDFARAYFYIMTAYDDISWRDDKGGEKMYTIADGKIELQPWVAKMLLEWSAADPVDSKEYKRNEEIFKYQKNRNPFIDYPVLAEYIWGSKKGDRFSVAGNEATVVNRPTDPEALDVRLTDVNTYASNYWGDRELAFNTDSDSELWISLDGGTYQRYGDRIQLPAGTTHGDKHVVKAYALANWGERTLKSSIVTVTMSVKNPDETDYSEATWSPVKNIAEITSDGHYLILASDNSHVMGSTFQSNGFMPDCGFAEFGNSNDETEITAIPKESAVIQLQNAGNSAYALKISDTHGVFKGFWNCTAAKKMKLDANQGAAAAISIDENGNARIDFGETPGWLQYNKTNPRFLNYSSTQGGVKLYKFTGFTEETSAIVEMNNEETPIILNGRNIILPKGGEIYDLQGRNVSGADLMPGIYVVKIYKNKSVKILIR